MITYFVDKEYMQKGQSMLEAVAALGVISIIMTALTIAVMLGLGNSGYSKKNNLATQYAQQGMEYLRNLRERDGTKFWGYNGSYYLGLNSDPFLSTPSFDYCTSQFPPSSISPNISSGGNYIRTTCIKDDPSCGASPNKKITVSTWWQDGKCAGNGYCRKASIASCFSDTRVPTP